MINGDPLTIRNLLSRFLRNPLDWNVGDVVGCSVLFIWLLVVIGAISMASDPCILFECCQEATP